MKLHRRPVHLIVFIAITFLPPRLLAQQQHETLTTTGGGTAGVHIESDATYPDASVQTDNATTRRFRFFDPASVGALRMGTNGITTNDYFSVGGPAPAGYQFYAITAATYTSTALQLRSSYDGTSRSYIGNFGTWGTYLSTNRDPRDGSFYEAAAADPKFAVQMMIGTANAYREQILQIVNFPLVNGVPKETHRLVIDYNGRVGIGTQYPAALLHVAGDVVVDGNIGAKFQDVAEWVPASSDLQPGTVVVLNPNRDNEVMPSTRAYDTTVAGVVSAQPGLVLGEGSASKETVATMGRVRVRVDARRASVAIGDLLVTSDRPGYAMKSVPIDMSGTAIHQPGTIIGKALQPLAEGEGEILVLLSLQ
jgi:hypothetical protein